MTNVKQPTENFLHAFRANPSPEDTEMTILVAITYLQSI